jgi:anaerobic ribonucleoside-triphosphate reductase activating protein
MKYKAVQTTFSEVPNEVSLTFLISGCPIGCDGCHSDDAWDGKGIELNIKVLSEFINKYEFLITTVCFLGGEWEKENLIKLLDLVKSRGLKTCLYTGLDKVHPRIEERLDFIKTGKWIEELGGLDSKRTNQKFIELATKRDLTSSFLKTEQIKVNNI